MSGHSKWSTIKRAKGAKDAQRGVVFTKMSKLIAIAARKGGDPEANFELRMAIDKAKSVNTPKDNIERAIKKGTGELNDGVIIEELLYEGLGPAQSQFVVKVLTDNRNRSAASIRHIFSKHGGSLGAVIWNFNQQGVIMIKVEELKKTDWDELELTLIDQDVLDIDKENEGITIYTKPTDLQKIKQLIENKGLVVESADVEYVAKEKKVVSDEEQVKIDKLIESLEEDEDVAGYYTNIE